MQIVGFIISILIYAGFIPIIVFLCLGIFQKKFNFSFFVLKGLFLYSFITMAVESWALIMIADGFNIYFNINFDYVYTLFIIIPVSAFLVFSGYRIKTKVKIDNIFDQIGIFLLPALTVVAMGASTIVLFFNINYFTIII